MNQIENFITTMSKVEPAIHLECAFQRETLLIIAEQNEIAANMKRFRDWVDLLDNPDLSRLNEMTKMFAGWLQIPDDLTRFVYDLGVHLAKQNVKYAEVHVNPVLFMQQGMTFEQFLDTLNDGRDRVFRGWGTRLSWVLIVPRDEPRRADEIARWAATTAARKGHVVGFGLVGPEDAQPVGQFERSFSTAEKKEIPTIAQAGNTLGVAGIQEIIEHLQPQRIVDSWRMVEDDALMNQFADEQIPVVSSISRAMTERWIDEEGQYPIRELYDGGINVIMSCPIPTYSGTTLTDEYRSLVENFGFELDEIEEVALNALQYSFLPENEKAELLAEFQAEYKQLKEELVSQPEGS